MPKTFYSRAIKYKGVSSADIETHIRCSEQLINQQSVTETMGTAVPEIGLFTYPHAVELI